MFFSKEQSVIGVDIGTSDIKIVQITHGAEKRLDTYGIVNLSYHIDNNDSEQAIKKSAELLSELLKAARVTTKRCIISLPNSAVFTSVIQMPKMPEKELAQALEYEAKKYVPLPSSEVVLSWSIVSQDERAGTQNILLTAVPRRVRESYLKVFDYAGLSLEIIEIEALALIRSLIFDTRENNVIIDIGAKTTGINFMKNGLLQLSRSLNIGGDTITQRIAEVLNVSQLRAEQFKKDFGISESTFIPDAVKPILNTIKAEIKKLLTIYQAQNVTVNKILLVGGGAGIPGLVDYFSDIGPAVSLGDPLRSVTYPKELEPVLKRYGLHLSVAIGLALRKDG